MKSNAHVVNEKVYVVKGSETMFDVNHSWCGSISWKEEEDCVVCLNISLTQSWPPHDRIHGNAKLICVAKCC